MVGELLIRLINPKGNEEIVAKLKEEFAWWGYDLVARDDKETKATVVIRSGKHLKILAIIEEDGSILKGEDPKNLVLEVIDALEERKRASYCTREEENIEKEEVENKT